MDTMTIIKPDDLHVHVRQGEIAKQLIQYTAKQFGRATIMPNLKPPITTVEKAKQYYKELIDATIDEHPNFQPLMTLYLTDETTPKEIDLAASTPHSYVGEREGSNSHAKIIGAKLYPAGATTNSAEGMTDLYNSHAKEIFETMEACGLPLLIHGEMASGDVFDREEVFIRNHLLTIASNYPNLKIVLEHITTRYAVEFVASQWFEGRNVGATITAHHLLANRTDMLGNGMNPHMYCKPILKTEHDRQALVNAAISGHPCFFAGTDSAPHEVGSKHSSCCAAGCFTAPYAVELYAEVFERENKFEHFQKFMSVNGAEFFGLPLNKETITLKREKHTVPQSVTYITIDGGDYQNTKQMNFHHFWGGKELNWKLV